MKPVALIAPHLCTWRNSMLKATLLCLASGAAAFVYPEAQGCDDALNAYCKEHCKSVSNVMGAPLPKSSGA